MVAQIGGNERAIREIHYRPTRHVEAGRVDGAKADRRSRQSTGSTPCVEDRSMHYGSAKRQRKRLLSVPKLIGRCVQSSLAKRGKMFLPVHISIIAWRVAVRHDVSG